MSLQFVRTNGVTLCCRDHPGGEPAVVLLPGLTVSGSFFEALIGAGLAPRSRIVALDLRGRGRSDAPQAGFDADFPSANYTMSDHTADVLGIFETLGVHRPVLVGHSFGGMLALYLAACAPQQCSRVVVLDAAISLASPYTRESLKPILERLDQVKPSWEEYLLALKRQPYFHGWWDQAIEDYFREDAWTDCDGRVRTRAMPDAIRRAVEGMLEVDWPTVILKIKQPVLLVNATGPFGPPGSPPFLTRSGALATARAMSNCRYLAVPGNHITMAFGENARQTAEAVASFIAGEDVGERPRSLDDTSDTIQEAIQRQEAEALRHTT
jgi:pimeloyl-ACP methyl ester carboxylesterase